MNIISVQPDSLSLSAVKEHINVDFVEDDNLINGYILSSLNYVEKLISADLNGT